MATGLTTSVTELEESRVRVAVEVGSDEVEREVVKAAGALAADIKVPGFRKGKAPPPVVLQRVGRESVLDEAVRGALPGWYEEAVGEAGIDTVGEPSVELTELPAKGAALAFSFEVGVLPAAELGDYRGLEVGRPEAEVSSDEIDAELERLRDSLASLETVERAAATGDFAVVDFDGAVDGEPFDGGSARGHMIELGSGRLLPGFEEQLEGALAGERRDVHVTFPVEHPVDALAGREAVFDVSLKEVKEKRLPDADDDFAVEIGGFDSFEELRADVESRLREDRQGSVEAEFRGAVVDAVVEHAKLDIPHELVRAKAADMWRATARRLRDQGIDPARYLEATDKTEEQVVADAEPDAERALGRESALARVVEVERLEVSDEELLESLRSAMASEDGPGEDGANEETLRRSLEHAKEHGRDDALRRDVAMRKAVDLLVEHARPIAAERARAREEIWTPEQDEPAESKQLWTPGS